MAGEPTQELSLGVFAGGTTLDIYANPGRYTSLMEGVDGGCKGMMGAKALRLASIAIFSSRPVMSKLGLPKALGIKTHAGGGAASGAAGYSYLGGEATLVTILGNGDPVSNLIRQDLNKIAGLTLAEVPAGSQRPPRRSINLREDKTGAVNRVWLTEEERPLNDEVRDAFIERVHRSSRGAGFLALSSLAPNLVRPVIEGAPAPVAINPSSAWYGNGHSAKLLPELKDILYGSGLYAVELNESEMTALHGQAPTVENARRLSEQMSREVGYVVCTFGRDGAILVAHNEDSDFVDDSFNIVTTEEPPVPDEYFVDNGGAGDAFFAGVLHGVANGLELEGAIKQGRLLAGLALMDRSAHGYVHKDLDIERAKLGL